MAGRTGGLRKTPMREPSGRWFGAALLLGLSVLAAGPAPARAGGPEDGPQLADYFGFLPLEVYKLDPRVRDLLTRDLDGDKVDDVVVSNNARSRIDLFLSGKGPAA